MSRIILAFESDSARLKVRKALETLGYTPTQLCKSGADTLRAVRRLSGGVVVAGYRLSDMTADQLTDDIAGAAQCLILGRSEELERLETRQNVVLLAMPLRVAALGAALADLIDRDERRFAAAHRRSDGDAALIQRAKALIQEQYGLSEPEAHRYLQRRSMLRGQKLAETARDLLGEKDT